MITRLGPLGVNRRHQGPYRVTRDRGDEWSGESPMLRVVER
jgi:hypothetical protein